MEKVNCLKWKKKSFLRPRCKIAVKSHQKHKNLLWHNDLFLKFRNAEVKKKGHQYLYFAYLILIIFPLRLFSVYKSNPSNYKSVAQLLDRNGHLGISIYILNMCNVFKIWDNLTFKISSFIWQRKLCQWIE